MQDRIQSIASNRTLAPPAGSAPAPEPQEAATPSPSSAAPAPAPAAAEESSMLDQSLTSLRETLDEHKGKLAISAAAMLGLLIYYKWGEKSLAKENPAEYERLQRLREGLRHADYGRRSGDKPAPSSTAKPPK